MIRSNYWEATKTKLTLLKPLLTVFADVELPEVDEVGDGCWQHSQVVIGHAQPVEQVTIK